MFRLHCFNANPERQPRHSSLTCVFHQDWEARRYFVSSDTLYLQPASCCDPLLGYLQPPLCVTIALTLTPRDHHATRIVYTQSVKTGRRQADRPLYAIVSEELVGKAGSLVMALSTPQRGPKAGAPFHVIPRVPADGASGARVSDWFALLELPVEPPVDLIVGGRWVVLI